MSAEPQYRDSEFDHDVPASSHLSAVRERRSLRVVGGGGPEAAPAPRPRSARAPLAAAPQTRARRRVPVVAATLLGVLATLAVVLLLNISMSSNQYTVVQLHQKEQELKDKNQSLSEEIEFQQAPQDLADRAASLGMVSGSTEAQLDLEKNTVSGTPQPAPAYDGDKEQNLKTGADNLVAAPQDSDTDAATEAEKRKAAKAAAEKKSAQKKADQAKADADRKNQDQGNNGAGN